MLSRATSVFDLESQCHGVRGRFAFGLKVLRSQQSLDRFKTVGAHQSALQEPVVHEVSNLSLFIGPEWIKVVFVIDS